MARILGIVLCMWLVGSASQAATVFATDRVVFDASHISVERVDFEQGLAPGVTLPLGTVAQFGSVSISAAPGPSAPVLGVGAGRVPGLASNGVAVDGPDLLVMLANPVHALGVDVFSSFVSPVMVVLIGADYGFLGQVELQLDGRGPTFFGVSAGSEIRAVLMWNLGLGNLAIDALVLGNPEPQPDEPVLSSAPLPGALVLLLTGVLGLAGVARKRRSDA